MLLALHRRATRSHRPSMALTPAAAFYRASGLVLLTHMRHTSHTASRSGSLRLDARCADHPAPESEVCQGLMTKTAPQALGVPHNRFGSAWRQHSFLDTSHGHGDFNRSWMWYTETAIKDAIERACSPWTGQEIHSKQGSNSRTSNMSHHVAPTSSHGFVCTGSTIGKSGAISSSIPISSPSLPASPSTLADLRHLGGGVTG